MMTDYIVKVKHDNGTSKIRVKAINPQEARKTVMRVEGCPECAIVYTGEAKPAKINELEALQNAGDSAGLKIHDTQTQDKRKTINRYFATCGGVSVSPILDYKQLNHFILGWIKCLKTVKSL